jgi:hypothetical protein
MLYLAIANLIAWSVVTSIVATNIKHGVTKSAPWPIGLTALGTSIALALWVVVS